ncbi:MAG TPA: antibiotic biosynthesis monooxygenase [Tepidiformaceae bacterium]|nr:antibiotic biosynthesis monooxygenase [Tepidiformaceae bacterium]
MFIAMNQFEVNPERADEFEAGWRARESHLAEQPGFIAFALLKGDEPGDFISHTTWNSRAAFLAWAEGEAFRRAHGGRMPEGIIVGHPRARFYDAVIEERAPGRG